MRAAATRRSNAASLVSALQSRLESSSFSTATAAAYPRRATPFRPAKASADDLDLPSSSSPSASRETSKEAWYLSETPKITNSFKEAIPQQTQAPPPPDGIPHFLHPLWTHLCESPFIYRDSIRFIDSQAAQSKVAVEDMDASVSSWVDWVVITTLRKGRERGIRGASDGVMHAVRECLLMLPENAGVEQDALNPSVPKKKKKLQQKIRVEGLDITDPTWCLVDGGRMIVHIMTEKARDTWDVDAVAMSSVVDAPFQPKIPGAQY